MMLRHHTQTKHIKKETHRSSYKTTVLSYLCLKRHPVVEHPEAF